MPPDLAIGMIDHLGEYTHGIDDKRRLQIPAKWRPPADVADFKYRLLLTQTTDMPSPCLTVLPPAPWQALRDKVAGLSFGDPRAQTLRRLFRDADVVNLDSAGRICLPQTLAERAGIEREATLVGMLHQFQIWNPKAYQIVRQADDQNAPEALKLV